MIIGNARLVAGLWVLGQDATGQGQKPATKIGKRDNGRETGRSARPEQEKNSDALTRQSAAARSLTCPRSTMGYPAEVTDQFPYAWCRLPGLSPSGLPDMIGPAGSKHQPPLGRAARPRQQNSVSKRATAGAGVRDAYRCWAIQPAVTVARSAVATPELAAPIR